jgi:hypothetical protein
MVNTGPGRKASLRITSAGNLQLYGSNGTTQYGSDGATELTTGVWYRIEWKLEADTGGTDGYATVKIDGVTEINNVQVDNDTNGIGWFIVGKQVNRNGQSVNFYYADVLVASDDYPGEGSIITLLPNADGHYTDWTPSGVGADYTMVDDAPPNTSDYLISTKVVGNSETVRFQTLADVGITDPVDIHSVQCHYVANCGVWNNVRTQLRLRSNSTDYDLTSLLLIGCWGIGGYGYKSNTDPATGLAWILAGVNAVEFGCVENTTSNPTWLRNLCVEVAISPGTSGMGQVI